MFLDGIPNPPPRVLVIVVSQEGCGHCEEYMPRFVRIAAAYPDVAMMAMDANDDRDEAQRWMEQFKVESTPTTYVLRHHALGGGAWRVEGAVDDATIARTLDFARSMSR